MATGASEIGAVVESFEAASDLSAGLYKLVKLTANDTVGYSTTNAADGVLQNKPAAAKRAARVLFAGKTKLYFGETLTVRQVFAAAASGWAVKAVSGHVHLGRVTLGANSGYVGEGIVMPSLLSSTTSAQATVY